MKVYIQILLLSVIALQVSGFNIPNYPHHMQFDTVQADPKEEHWFSNQILDHFTTKLPHQHWNQRYFIYDEHYDQQKGPLFLYICGEEECRPLNPKTQYVAYLCQKYNGIAINLEHRFYGRSQPFGYNDETLELDHLKYLNNEQAIADIAVFIKYIKENKIAGISKDTPIITVGGSYPGALSAQFRYKYSHLTLGGYASSPGLNAIEDFFNYDNQVGISLQKFGDFCPETLRQVNKHIAQLLSTPLTNRTLKQQYNSTDLTDDEFLEQFADIIAYYVQYGHSQYLCNNIFKGKSVEEITQYLSKRATDSQSYVVSVNQITKYDPTSVMRQYTYQMCTYWGWMQTAYKPNPMRSLKLDTTYFKDKCTSIFGQDYIPETANTNLLLGSTKLNVKNLIITNGSEDPQKWISLTHKQGKLDVYVSECIGCAHCQDLHMPKNTDPAELTQTRNSIETNISQWLSEYNTKIYGSQNQERISQ